MRIEKEWLVPTNAPLVGFEGMKVYPIGTVTFPMMVGDYPQQITKDGKGDIMLFQKGIGVAILSYHILLSLTKLTFCLRDLSFLIFKYLF